MAAIARAPRPLRALINKRTERENCENFHSLLKDKFIDNGRIGPLLTLYTLEALLYGVLRNNANAFTALLFLHSTNIDAYKWEVQKTRFCS